LRDIIKTVTLLTSEDSILDFVSEVIREEQIKTSIYQILSANPSINTCLCIRVPYYEEPYCALIKWKKDIKNSGLVLILSKDWRLIIDIFKSMIGEANAIEREFLYSIIDSAETQFKTLEKL